MKKIIKKYGNAFIIRITPDDMKIYDLKEGDVVDISDMVKVNGGKK